MCRGPIPCFAMMSRSEPSLTHAESLCRIARSWIGVRFRAQGRGRCGVDCIGLVGAIWREMGVQVRLPADYHLRRTPRSRIEAGLIDHGFCEVSLVQADLGDLLLAEPAPGQTHIALLIGATLIEANLRAGRVVERRHTRADHWVSAWRYREWSSGWRP